MPCNTYLAGNAQAEQFSYCQPWMLAWGYRKQNLIAELVSYNADIMCLQVCYCPPSLLSPKCQLTLLQSPVIYASS